MKNFNAHLLNVPLLLVMVASSMPSLDANAAALPLVTAPLYLTSAVPPLVMLNITKDQNLYQKAYNDYSDLDGDGKADTMYKHTIDYYGYFDSYKCYTYASGMFSPVGASYTGTKPATCSGNWHGNFLNWVSMSRMDALRKLLYGGLRQTDTLASTVLERAFIPTDAHSWPKYYNPAMALAFDVGSTAATYPSINSLTPYNPTSNPAAIASATSNSLTLGRKLFDVPATTAFAYGDQVLIEDASNASNYMIGAVGCVNATGITMYNGLAANTSSCAAGQIAVVIENAVNSSGAGALTSWKIYNWTQTGITFCNTTMPAGGGVNNISHTNTNPPLIKVALGNFSLWSANERWQCYWQEEKAPSTTGIGASGNNGNRAAMSGVYASTLTPNKTTVSSGRILNGAAGANSDFNVRVQACVTGAIGKEKCGSYPSGNYKPIGLLQVYGESGQLKFGLMTGSYTKNTSGGVLRKNVGAISDEIYTTTDGTFKAAPAAGSIIASLNLMRIYGYNYSDGTYMTGGDTCTYGLTTITEGQCLNWGNPMSEIYLESIRYMAGLTATAAFNTSDTTKIAGLVNATWVDPLSNANYCAPLNVLNFNASAPSYDRDQMGGSSALGGAPNAATLTTAVGNAEGIGGGNWYVGNNGTTNNDLCSAKPISALGSAYGICPEGPGTEGSYLMAGLAYHVHTNRIRNDLTSVPGTSVDKTSLKVSTYGIALATNVPKINVPGTSVTILPLGRLLNGGAYGGGTLVDFKIVCQIPITASVAEVAAVRKDSAGMCAAAGSGAFYINWEDSEQGGDYDQDMWGRLKYQINAGATPTVTITTDVVAQSTPYLFGFGYSISGTTQDGPHIHSGINAFVFADPTAPTVTGDLTNLAGGGCNGCTSANLATSVTYTQSGTVSGVLNDPLWYAAKYGGFKDTNNNNLPDQVSEWDIRTSSGANGADGIPDNYFFVTNPNALEAALDQAFIAILTDSSSSSVAASTTKLNTNTYIYQASFNATDWSGMLQSFKIDPANGSIAATPAWNSGAVINTQDYSSGRAIITYNPASKVGVPFRWANLSTGAGSQQAYLNRDPNSGNAVDAVGSARLDYLRGNAANEGLGTTNFRRRTISKLGDIVDSSPSYVGAPNFGYVDLGYSTFMTTYANRTPIVYVGSNDGMLHGFSAATGEEKLAYVPNKLFANLNQLTARNYSHRYFVNGSPAIGDAYFSTGSIGWKTVLVGGLGNGGRGVYALDVTNPSNFTEANAGSLVLWEFTDADDPDLGFTQSQVSIVKVCVSSGSFGCTTSKWVAIFGNGYNNTQAASGEVASTTGQSALYVLYLDKPLGTAWTLGTNYFKILTGVGSVGTPNGLASPSAIDADGDDIVDFVYAGDLQGNMYRFDLTSAPSAWNKQVLITVRDGLGAVQPITSAPEVGMHRTGSGLMVFFGTGQYLATGDNLTSGQQTQTFYGIWDKLGMNSSGWALPSAPVEGLRSSANFHLLKQIIYTETVGVDGNAARVTSDTADVPNKSQYYMDWVGSVGVPANTGWYIDLYNTNYLTTPSTTNFGERQVTNSVLANKVIEFATLIPNASACTAGGSGWIMKLDPNDGGRTKSAFVSTTGVTNAVNVSVTTGGGPVVAGILVGGSKSATGIPTTVTIISDKNSRYEYTSLSSGVILTTISVTNDMNSLRVGWREIVD